VTVFHSWKFRYSKVHGARRRFPALVNVAGLPPDSPFSTSMSPAGPILRFAVTGCGSVDTSVGAARSTEAAQQAASVVRELELGRVAELAAALPGTESAGTAAELGPHWADTCVRWAQGMDSYASALTSAAEDYQEQDDATARLRWRGCPLMPTWSEITQWKPDLSLPRG
jgi:hypothetical protein